MSIYFWIALGSALGGILRFALTRLMLPFSATFPWSTVAVNVLGCFAIGYIGTATLPGSRHAISETARLFLMVGVCGGFTTFSSFSLETLDLLRGGAPTRAFANVVLAVLLCLFAVAAGHAAAHYGNHQYAIAQTREEELAG